MRWYLRFRLPYADMVELLAERSVHVDPSSVFDWVHRFTPLYKDAARPVLAEKHIRSYSGCSTVDVVVGFQVSCAVVH